jgi:hypothetical protein
MLPGAMLLLSCVALPSSAFGVMTGTSGRLGSKRPPDRGYDCSAAATVTWERHRGPAATDVFQRATMRFFWAPSFVIPISTTSPGWR